MKKILLEIESCKECKFFAKTNGWSSDGWDKMEDWICLKHKENSSPKRNKSGDIILNNEKGKMIEGCVEWHEESRIEIPEWCPILFKN